MGNDGAAIELLAKACDMMARRAQPQTVAARLTLADHGQVLQALDGVLSGTHRGALDMACALPDGNLRAVGDRVAVQVDRGHGYVQNAIEVTGRMLMAIQCAPGQRSLSPGRRPLATAARDASIAAHDFGTLSGKRFGQGEALRWYGLLSSVIADLGSTCSYLAILTDRCAERAGLGPYASSSCPLIEAYRELRHAQHHLRVITLTLRDAA